jgi:hypothetical protein
MPNKNLQLSTFCLFSPYHLKFKSKVLPVSWSTRMFLSSVSWDNTTTEKTVDVECHLIVLIASYRRHKCWIVFFKIINAGNCSFNSVKNLLPVWPSAHTLALSTQSHTYMIISTLLTVFSVPSVFNMDKKRTFWTAQLFFYICSPATRFGHHIWPYFQAICINLITD